MDNNRSTFLNSLLQSNNRSTPLGLNNSRQISLNKKKNPRDLFVSNRVSGAVDPRSVSTPFNRTTTNQTSFRTQKPTTAPTPTLSITSQLAKKPTDLVSVQTPSQAPSVFNRQVAQQPSAKTKFFNTVAETQEERQRRDDLERENRTQDASPRESALTEETRIARENVSALNQQIADEIARTRRKEDDIRRNERGALAQGVDNELRNLQIESSERIADLTIAKGVATDILQQLRLDGETEQDAVAKIQSLGEEIVLAGGTPEQVEQVLSSPDFQSALSAAAQSGLLREEVESQGGFTLGKDQTRFEYNQDTGRFESVGTGISSSTGTTGTFKETGVVSDLTQGIVDGVAQLSDLTPTDRSKVIAELSASGMGDVVGQEKAQNINSLVSQMINHPGLKGATGKSSLIPAVPGMAKYQFERLFDQLKGLLTLDNLGLMKGVLSDADIKILTNAATSLDLGLSDTDFKNTLMKISGGTTDISEVDMQTTSDGTRYRVLPDGNIEVFEDFNSVGNTSASVQIPQSSRLAFVNNNPGNLRFAQQPGASRGEGGFARFNSPEAGFEALMRQIRLDASRGLTLSQFVNKFAPPVENDTQKYIRDIESMLGIQRNTPINSIDTKLLAQAVARKESSTNIA